MADYRTGRGVYQGEGGSSHVSHHSHDTSAGGWLPSALVRNFSVDWVDTDMPNYFTPEEARLVAGAMQREGEEEDGILQRSRIVASDREESVDGDDVDGELNGDGDGDTIVGTDTRQQNAVSGAGRRNINTFQLAIITYFFTCGGPFGVEPSVNAAGPLYTLIGFVVAPLLWSVPQSLMAAELSLMMKQNGGNILWAKRAFGHFGGWINAYNNIIYFIISLSLNIVLLTAYLPSHLLNQLENWHIILIKFGFVSIVTILNIIGIQWITRVSYLLMVAILAPFVVQWIDAPIRLHDQMHWGDVLDRPSSIHFGVFVSTVLWSYGGFDAMGTFAGEVKGGKSTYIKGILFAMPFDIATYFFPVFIGYVLSPNMKTGWGSGYFTTVAEVEGYWMAIWVFTTSVMANFGTYAVGIASLSRCMWACGRGPQEVKLLPGFVSWDRRSKNGARSPVAAIIIIGVCTFALSLGTFNLLVQATMVIRLVNLGFEYGALVKLRFSAPDMPRPFRLPGGKLGTIALCLPSLALAGLLLAGCDWQVYVIAGGVNAAVLLLYLLRTVLLHVFYGEHRQIKHTGYTINYTTAEHHTNRSTAD
eukprot:TRINITY_DN7520_c0_g1_i1.p1 TRINITY_DN7520_c0_g1~~TRINITY_DN7520_c0_g1_i1.p1  ORF type:complete len:588 (+),score=89.19 TRINITY_DN7520_c0_g1_i1:38-1801(+)